MLNDANYTVNADGLMEITEEASQELSEKLADNLE
jgi:hypothetical protein